MKKRLSAVVLTAALLPALVACGDDDATPAGTDREIPTNTGATRTAPDPGLRITDPWVKAAPGGMTGLFAVLVNDGPREVTVVSASTAAARQVELHETVQNPDGSMVMRAREGGFVVPAGGSRELAPGGDHVMLMGLTGPLEPGSDVEVTLTLDDGSTSVVTATVKAFDGADEKYQNGGGH